MNLARDPFDTHAVSHLHTRIASDVQDDETVVHGGNQTFHDNLPQFDAAATRNQLRTELIRRQPNGFAENRLLEVAAAEVDAPGAETAPGSSSAKDGRTLPEVISRSNASGSSVEPSPTRKADEVGRLKSRDELGQENEVPRDPISRLTAAILRISESLDLGTVLREVVDGARAVTDGRSRFKR